MSHYNGICLLDIVSRFYLYDILSNIRPEGDGKLLVLRSWSSLIIRLFCFLLINVFSIEVSCVGLFRYFGLYFRHSYSSCALIKHLWVLRFCDNLIVFVYILCSGKGLFWLVQKFVSETTLVKSLPDFFSLVI